MPQKYIIFTKSSTIFIVLINLPVFIQIIFFYILFIELQYP